MAARPIAVGSISFGLVSIPVKLFAATRSKAVSFKLLHAKDKSRIQQRIYCPVDDAIIDRSELIRGFEVEKGVFVTFSDEELEKLEARGDHVLEITEFVPLNEVDPVHFNAAYHLGCQPESARAYRLLTDAMAKTDRVALGRFTLRNKENLVLLRPYENGLMLHTMYYADEVVAVEGIDRGQNVAPSEREVELAERLIGDLTHEKFDPSQYKDSYRERVLEAAARKREGQEAVTAPAPEAQRGKVIDLMSALKASLEKRGRPAPAEEHPNKQAASGGGGRVSGGPRRSETPAKGRKRK